MKNKQLKWLILIILALTWGTSFILIKKSIHYFSPYSVGALRVAIAGTILLPFGIYNLKYIPKKAFPWLLASGFLGNFFPMFMFPIAEKHLSSSLAGILNSLVPIFVLIFGLIFFRAKTTKRQILGAIIGFFGAFILIYFSNNQHNIQTQSNVFWYAMLIVIATIIYAFSALIIKEHLSEIPSFRLSSVVFSILFFPSILILIFSGFHTEFQQVNETQNAWLGIGYVSILAVLGTAIAMILFYKLIQISSTVFASSVTYLMPIIALLWGIFDGEKLKLIHISAMLIILFGVYIIQQKKPNHKK